MYMTVFMFLVHNIVVLSTCCDDIYGMWSYLMHKVGLMTI